MDVDTDEGALHVALSAFGRVESAQILRARDGASLRIGSARMSTAAEATAAIAAAAAGRVRGRAGGNALSLAFDTLGTKASASFAALIEEEEEEDAKPPAAPRAEPQPAAAKPPPPAAMPWPQPVANAARPPALRAEPQRVPAKPQQPQAGPQPQRTQAPAPSATAAPPPPPPAPSAGSAQAEAAAQELRRKRQRWANLDAEVPLPLNGQQHANGRQRWADLDAKVPQPANGQQQQPVNGQTSSAQQMRHASRVAVTSRLAQYPYALSPNGAQPYAHTANGQQASTNGQQTAGSRGLLPVGTGQREAPSPVCSQREAPAPAGKQLAFCPGAQAPLSAAQLAAAQVRLCALTGQVASTFVPVSQPAPAPLRPPPPPPRQLRAVELLELDEPPRDDLLELVELVCERRLIGSSGEWSQFIQRRERAYNAPLKPSSFPSFVLREFLRTFPPPALDAVRERVAQPRFIHRNDRDDDSFDNGDRFRKRAASLQVFDMREAVDLRRES
ncbi:hypothetical protein T492DRAFT_1097716 [Pavlovales sp. CCMP2436]|nr:hypothetical protein T492DRAFT_1097716 [Pavlovales sp. CCMP2436]